MTQSARAFGASRECRNHALGDKARPAISRSSLRIASQSGGLRQIVWRPSASGRNPNPLERDLKSSPKKASYGHRATVEKIVEVPPVSRTAQLPPDAAP